MAPQKNTRNTVVSIEDAIKEVNIEGGRGDRVKAMEATRKVNMACQQKCAGTVFAVKNI